MERLKGCPEAIAVFFETVTVVALSDVWKGPETQTLTLQYTEGDGMNCGPMLHTGDRIGLIADHRDDGTWGTADYLIAPLSTFGTTDNAFGHIAHPILAAYRAETRSLAADLAQTPDDINLNLRFGAHLERGHDLDAAIALYRRLLASNPTLADAHAGLVRSLQLDKEFTAALTAAETGLRQLPDDPELEMLRRRQILLLKRDIDPRLVDFRGLEGWNLRLGDQDLRGIDFSEARIGSTSFANTKLDGANFTDAELIGAEFFSASMNGVNLTNADVESARFYNASLKAADFSQTRSGQSLQISAFIDSDLTGARFAGNELMFDPGRGDDPGFGAIVMNANLAGATLSCTPIRAHYFRDKSPADSARIWTNALRELAIIRDLAVTQKGVTLDKSCATAIDHDLALPAECRPWKFPASTHGCAFLPE
nr:pentapeptide repeat-containing protein [uncultured Dongia sp.]